MIYRAIGLMSGSSLDGLDIVFTELEETGGKWKYTILQAESLPYTTEWAQNLSNSANLNAADYMRLHTAYGEYTGAMVNAFIEKHQLQHKVQLIGSHGHTVFHDPKNKTTGQIGNGAAIAAATGVNVVSDLRAMDMALGGQGAPIVTIGEKFLMPEFSLLLNLGGIANISSLAADRYIAFDICPANRVLNMLAQDAGFEYDDDGKLAQKGFVRDEPLAKMNQQPYYITKYPKSLDNQFGTHTIYPILKQANLSPQDALRTMVEHINIQITRSVGKLANANIEKGNRKMLVTGGGAFNGFLMERLDNSLKTMNVSLEIPDANLIKFKEALIMALLAVLRWREEDTVLHTATGAVRSSVGGAVWLGR